MSVIVHHPKRELKAAYKQARREARNPAAKNMEQEDGAQVKKKKATKKKKKATKKARARKA